MAKIRKPKGQYSEEIFPSSLGKMSRKKKLSIDLQSENVCVPQPSLLGEHGASEGHTYQQGQELPFVTLFNCIYVELLFKFL